MLPVEHVQGDTGGFLSLSYIFSPPGTRPLPASTSYMMGVQPSSPSTASQTARSPSLEVLPLPPRGSTTSSARPAVMVPEELHQSFPWPGETFKTKEAVKLAALRGSMHAGFKLLMGPSQYHDDKNEVPDVFFEMHCASAPAKSCKCDMRAEWVHDLDLWVVVYSTLQGPHSHYFDVEAHRQGTKQRMEAVERESGLPYDPWTVPSVKKKKTSAPRPVLSNPVIGTNWSSPRHKGPVSYAPFMPAAKDRDQDRKGKRVKLDDDESPWDTPTEPAAAQSSEASDFEADEADEWRHGMSLKPMVDKLAREPEAHLGVLPGTRRDSLDELRILISAWALRQGFALNKKNSGGNNSWHSLTCTTKATNGKDSCPFTLKIKRCQDRPQGGSPKRKHGKGKARQQPAEWEVVTVNRPDHHNHALTGRPDQPLPPSASSPARAPLGKRAKQLLEASRKNVERDLSVPVDVAYLSHQVSNFHTEPTATSYYGQYGTTSATTFLQRSPSTALAPITSSSSKFRPAPTPPEQSEVQPVPATPSSSSRPPAEVITIEDSENEEGRRTPKRAEWRDVKSEELDRLAAALDTNMTDDQRAQVANLSMLDALNGLSNSTDSWHVPVSNAFAPVFVTNDATSTFSQPAASTSSNSNSNSNVVSSPFGPAPQTPVASTSAYHSSSPFTPVQPSSASAPALQSQYGALSLNSPTSSPSLHHITSSHPFPTPPSSLSPTPTPWRPAVNGSTQDFNKSTSLSNIDTRLAELDLAELVAANKTGEPFCKFLFNEPQMAGLMRQEGAPSLVPFAGALVDLGFDTLDELNNLFELDEETIMEMIERTPALSVMTYFQRVVFKQWICRVRHS